MTAELLKDAVEQVSTTKYWRVRRFEIRDWPQHWIDADFWGEYLDSIWEVAR